MKKLNFILCIIAVLVFLAQIFVMFQPYFTYAPKTTLKERQEGVVKPDIHVSLERFVWVEYVDMEDFMLDGLKKEGAFESGDPKEELENMSNTIVMGVVGTTVLGLVMAVMTIFTRKSTVGFGFSLAWALVSVYCVLADNPVLQKLGTEAAKETWLPALTILAFVSLVVVLARAVPWVYSRYIIPQKESKARLQAYLEAQKKAA